MTHHPTTDARSCAYDLLVAGAGVAGIAAALEAARAGLDVALVEKTVLVGGLATTGLINIYLPLCDGRGHQVIYGIAEELLHLSIKYGPGDVPPGWRDPAAKAEGQRYRTPFNPASFILALDEALEEAGVDLWLDTLITRPVLEGDRLAGVVVENKSGSATLRAKCVIDATGDGDLAYRAGAPCAEGDNWLCIWALQCSLERAQRAVADPDGVSLLDRLNLGGSPGGAGHPEGLPPFRGTEGRQVTEFILGGRRMLRDHYVERQALGGVNDRRQLFPVTLPSMAQFRTTRRILGREGMAGGEEGRYRDTSIGLTGDWRKAGPIWEIPYGALVPTGVRGLLVAGRCVASEGDAWEVMRVIPPSALTGQVAAIAARLALARSRLPDELDVADIQTELGRMGMPYHINQVAG